MEDLGAQMTTAALLEAGFKEMEAVTVVANRRRSLRTAEFTWACT